MREGWTGWVRRLTAIDFSRQTRGLFVPLSILSGLLFLTFPPPLFVFLVRSYSAFRLSSSLSLAPGNTLALSFSLHMHSSPPSPLSTPSSSTLSQRVYVFFTCFRPLSSLLHLKTCTSHPLSHVRLRLCTYVRATYSTPRHTPYARTLACVRACKRSAASTSVRQLADERLTTLIFALERTLASEPSSPSYFSLREPWPVSFPCLIGNNCQEKQRLFRSFLDRLFGAPSSIVHRFQVRYQGLGTTMPDTEGKKAGFFPPLPLPPVTATRAKNDSSESLSSMRILYFDSCLISVGPIAEASHPPLPLPLDIPLFRNGIFAE